jgi:hypothetical protein
LRAKLVEACYQTLLLKSTIAKANNATIIFIFHSAGTGWQKEVSTIQRNARTTHKIPIQCDFGGCSEEFFIVVIQFFKRFRSIKIFNAFSRRVVNTISTHLKLSNLYAGFMPKDLIVWIIFHQPIFLSGKVLFLSLLFCVL